MYLSIASISAVLALAYFLVRRYDVLSHLFTIYLNFRYPIRDIETGRSLPTLPFVFPNGQGNVEKFLNGRANSVKWAAEYGPLYRIWSGFHGEIVVTRPSDIEAVFRDSHTHIKANANDSGYLMHKLLGDCLGLVSGAQWKSMRRATEPPFLHKATSSHVHSVLADAKDHVAGLFDTSSKSVGYLQPYADLRVYPFLALAEILYGGLSPSLRAGLLAIIPGRDSVFRAMIQGGITRYPISRFLPLKAIRGLNDFKKDWAKWNDAAYKEALEKFEKEEVKEPAPIIGMYDSISEGAMTREGLLQTLDEMLFANLDVSIGGLAWALIFLSVYPEEQNKLLQQIKSELPENEASFLLSQNNYLHHILLESGRLRPVAAFSVSQSCPTPRQLGNFVFPSGTKFIVDANALNVRDPLWGPDNTTFRPERWQEGGVQRAKDIRYCYWRFGFGPRVCLGKYIVDLMMKALIVELVKGWEVKLVRANGEPWPSNEDVWAIDPEMRISCTRRNESNTGA